MKRDHLKKLFDIIRRRYDLRELLAISFFLTLRKSLFKPIYASFFVILLSLYSRNLKSLQINHKDNIFITHKKRRFGPLNLYKICQNILTLDQNRLARKRSDFKAINYNLNTRAAKGLVVKHLLYEEYSENVIRVVFANLGIPYSDDNVYEPNPYISSKFFEIDKQKTAGISIHDSEGNLVATSIGFFTDDIFNIEFLVSAFGKDSQVARWVLHEAIVDLAHARGYKYLRISNYFTTSIKNIYFNRRLGYQDYNLI